MKDWIFVIDGQVDTTEWMLRFLDCFLYLYFQSIWGLWIMNNTNFNKFEGWYSIEFHSQISQVDTFLFDCSLLWKNTSLVSHPSGQRRSTVRSGPSDLVLPASRKMTSSKINIVRLFFHQNQIHNWIVALVTFKSDKSDFL